MVTSRRVLPLVIALAGVAAYALAPFTPGDRRISVPEGRALDAMQGSFLLGDGIDKLLSAPTTYYDTAILYPDRNQLRTTEPFVGFAVLGAPLRTLLRLDEADVFEVLRWLIVAASLVYAYLLLRALDLDIALSAAGALLCVGQPSLLNGVERLQVVSIPLVLALAYHGLKVWNPGLSGRRHRVGLFAWTALYPLCGIINATVLIAAGLLALPWLVTALLSLKRQHRLAAWLLPVLLALLVDALVLAPWIIDRADLNLYTSRAFLEIKRWNPVTVPVTREQVSAFLTEVVGLGLVAGLFMLAALPAARRLRSLPQDPAPASGDEVLWNRFLWAVPACAAAVVTAATLGPAWPGRQWLGLGFQGVCYAALLLYWVGQVRRAAVWSQRSTAQRAGALAAGLGVFLCALSFGPAYAGNPSPLASHLGRLLLDIMPPLKSIREYERFWAFGVLAASVSVTIGLGRILRGSSRVTRWVVAAVLSGGVIASLPARKLVASDLVEAPKDFIGLAAHSWNRGALYVHPYMEWNSIFGVLMIPAARELQRPIVNGYLGIRPPWFGYASNVLQRFPDPEAVWLLRTWKVQTVVSFAGDVDGRALAEAEKVFERGPGVVWDMRPSGAPLTHPSETDDRARNGPDRVELAGAQLRMADADGVELATPEGFQVTTVNIHFAASVVTPVPEAVEVYSLGETPPVRKNLGRSGTWLESLAADAYLQRRAPVAAVRLVGPQSTALMLKFVPAIRPPIERIVLVGEWIR